MAFEHGFISICLLLVNFLFTGLIDAVTLPEAFSADISGMPCSLFLVLRNNSTKVDRGKSTLKCFTKKKVIAPSAIVVNYDTEHIFELNLVANVKKTTLRSGILLPTREDFNFVAESINQELLDITENDLMNFPRKRKASKGNCLYQDATNVSWTEYQATGVRIKVLQLVKEKKPNTCVKFRKMSDNSNAGLRGFKRSKEITKSKVPSNNLTSQRNVKYDCSKALAAIGETGRSGWKTNTDTWPYNTIRYDPGEVKKESDRTHVEKVLAKLQKSSGQCIKFKINTTSKDRLILKALKKGEVAYGEPYKKDGGNLGLRPDGWTDNWLILHEFGHVIGLSHTQNREDAACFVRLFPNNIKHGVESAFQPYKSIRSVFGYDYRSVMHYRRNMFAIDDGEDTILPIEENKWANDIIGKGQEASLTDIQTIQHYYNCPIVIRWLGYKITTEPDKMPEEPKFCPAGMFVYGYRLRSQAKQGWWRDDTALNDIELYCKEYENGEEKKKEKIYSKYTSSGEWSRDTMCSGESDPVIGFNVRFESWQGPWGDSTGINGVGLLCKNHGHTYNPIPFPHYRPYGYLWASVNTNWGSAYGYQKCPEGMAVMGIRTQLNTEKFYGDKMSITGLELYCKPFPN